ncbi:MAG: M48 family metallopeptidase [Nanoarchaeota archaeon]|nr:M48 family metallopeptidase [Nanoarchaeota archaeon]
MKQKLSSFEEVRKNNILSNVLIFVFIVFIGILGSVIGLIYDNVYFGLVLSLIIGMIYFAVMYSSGDKIVLGLSGARQVEKRDYPHLFHTVEGLAVAAGIPAPKCYVINDSALNAFATGTKPENASITVTSGLLEVLNREELEGVVAHEMSHIKNQDIKYMLLVTVLIGIVTLLGDFMLRSFLWGGKSRKRNENGGQLQLILIVVGIAFAILSPIVTQIIRMAISRKKEYAADARAAILTRYPMGLANALKKIKKDPDPLVDKANRATAHLFISEPFRKVSSLFATHPPLDERIKRLEAM